MKNLFQFVIKWPGMVLIFFITSLIAQTEKDPNPTPFESTFSLAADPYYQQIVNQVSYDSIYSYLQELESLGIKEPGTTALDNTRNWIQQKLASYGYADIVYHDFTYSSYTLQNIITTKAGASQPDVYLIIDGHYDTINGPGVNDNGSGTAILLEVARLLADVECRLSIKFINFSAEEEGLIGSQAYVNNVAVPQNMNIKLVLNIDEVGGVAGMVNNTITCERDEGNPPGNNTASAAYTDTLATLTQTYSSLNTQIAHAYGSDYMPFEDAGYVITGFYEANESPYPHSPDDILANMDPAYVTEIARASVAAALYFARAETQYLTLYHSPNPVVQDTTNPYPVQLKVLSSSPVTEAKIKYRVNTGSFNALPLIFSWQNGDTLYFEGQIPPQNYYSVVDYYFQAENDDSIEARLPDDSSEYFQYTVLPDTLGPDIQHQPFTDLPYLMNPLEFTAVVTDKNGVQSVSLYLHKNDEPDQEFQMASQPGNRFVFAYWDSLSPGDSVYYRIKAQDNSDHHNIAWFPDTGYVSFEVLNSEKFDFELSANGFSGTGDWNWGSLTDPSLPQPQGQKIWATNLSGNYSGNLQSTLQSPVIDLTGKYDARLVLDHFYQIEPNNDGGNLKMSVDGGSFQLITPQNGYPYSNLWLFNEPGYSGNSYFWVQETFDLSAYAGHTVQFLFDFRSDIFTNKKGWYIDLVRVDYRGTASNHAPQITQFYPVELDSLEMGAQQTFSVSAQDPDNDSLTYTIHHNDVVITDSIATFTFDSAGHDTVFAVAEDNHGQAAVHYWAFVVYDPASSIRPPHHIARRYELLPPYPNPFNPQTVIRYRMKLAGRVDISVYNTIGQKVTILVKGYKTSGDHTAKFSAGNLPSGIYFVVMKTSEYQKSRRVLLLR